MTTTLIHLDDEIQILDLYVAAFARWSSTTNLKIKSFSTIREFESEFTAPQKVDIFIIDLYLGKSSEDGLALVSHCRALFPSSLILVSSNAKDHHLIHSSLKLGADDFIPKDIKTEGLVRLVDN
jgi:DNA-binding NtrC family response regulator